MVSKASNRYYVYTHFHPETKEVVYVGKGAGGRAWATGYSTAKASRGLRGNRTEEHQRWITELLEAGHTPGDYVQIVAQGLDNGSALDIEKETTEKYVSLCAKLFNLACYGTLKNTVLSPKQLAEASELRKQGVSYSKIAKTVTATTMTVWRALNNKTKAYKAAANGQ